MIKFRLEPKYYFGKGCLNKLPNEIKWKKYKNILLLSGKSSIKKNGIYDEVIELLKQTDTKIFECLNITPNPKDHEIQEAINICKQNKIDLILAIGGGSVVDASKVIAMLTTNNQYKEVWDFVLNPSLAKEKPIDIFSVITIAGTASENNCGSVITNAKLNIKKPVNSPNAVPKICFIDPTYTQTLSKWQLASGIFDCFSHCLDQYLGKSTFEWTNKYLLANAKNIVEYGTKLFNGEDTYEVRENISWTASMALNSLSTFNNKKEDWTTHVIEHAISGIYDITHGAGLAFITPTLLKVKSNHDVEYYNKAIKAANEIFGVNTIDEFIEKINQFIKTLGLPMVWNEFNTNQELDVDKLIKHIEYTEKNYITPEMLTIHREVLEILKNK